MGLNNMLPVNLNLKRYFNSKENKNLNLEKTDDFKEKIDRYSTKDKYKKTDTNEKVINKKDIKTYTNKDRNIKTEDSDKKEKNSIEDDISKDIQKVTDRNLDMKKEIDNESIENLDLKSEKDINQELENIIAFLQNANLQNINDYSKINNLKESISKINEGISDDSLKLKDIENLLKTLEEINLPEDFKNEILENFKSLLQEKIDLSVSKDAKKGLEQDSNLEVTNRLNKNDNTVKIDKKTKENISDENLVLEDVDKNNVSIKSTNESSDMNLLNHKDEELEKFEKEFLKIDENNEDKNINLDNLNIGKISQKIKGVMPNQKQINNVNSKEIIDQIVQKSKLAIDKDKSIMEIKLEPESLGKLTLRIAVERGLVTAKFTAENDKVKEIIESNMNELKNNLLAQGLNVQSLSVSVDSQGDLDRHKNILEAMAYNKKMSKNINIDAVMEEEKENPYLSIDDSFNQLA